MKAFKKILAITSAIFLVVSLMGVSFAESGSTPLYEKYEYKEDFEYEGEMIGHALKSSVAKIVMFYSAEIEYLPVAFDSDSFGQLVIAARQKYPEYSNEELKQFLLQYLQAYPEDFISYGSSKKVETSGQATGTGVVIAEDGYIATNTHVITLDDTSKLQIYQNALGEDIANNLIEVLEDVSQYGISFTDDEVNTIYGYVMNDAMQNAYINSESTDLEVWFPSADGGTSVDDAVRYEADILEMGTSVASEDTEGLTQDAAILKIDAENLVALKLSEEMAEINSEITAAGYPGASDAIFQSIGSQESVMSVTVNKGEVSKQVPIEGMEYMALETSVRISPGNSGGPSVDNRLDIEGLNTYTLVSDSRFAYMISAEYVKELASDYEIGQGEVSKTFLLGLQALQQGYGKTAAECFKKVQELQPDTPYIESLIKTAEKAPQEEMAAVNGSTDEKKGSGIAEFFEDNLILIIIIGGVVLVLIAIVIVSIVIIKKKKKAKVAAPAYASPAAPSASAGPIPPVAPTYAPPPTPTAPVPPVRPAAPVHSAFTKGASDFGAPSAPAVPQTPSAPASGTSGLKMSDSFKKSDDLG